MNKIHSFRKKKARDKDELLEILKDKTVILSSHTGSRYGLVHEQPYLSNLIIELSEDKRNLVQTVSTKPYALMYDNRLISFLAVGGFTEEEERKIKEENFLNKASNVNYKLAKETLKNIPKANLKSNLALFISIIVLLFELLKFLIEKGYI